MPAAGNVALPLDEYNQLVELANRTARKTEAPPLPYVLKRAEFNLTVTSGGVMGKIQVEGERVKPVEGADGARVPLLRAGFRPVDAYTVNFVYLHSGAPFAKQGGAELALPKMDVPINLRQ